MRKPRRQFRTTLTSGEYSKVVATGIFIKTRLSRDLFGLCNVYEAEFVGQLVGARLNQLQKQSSERLQICNASLAKVQTGSTLE